MQKKPLRVLVVDDTTTYRMIVKQVLARIEGVEVVGTAANGKIALEKIQQLKPDLLTLDIEMPVLDGLGVLRRLRDSNDPTAAIVLSALTTEGADATVQALRLGAYDFVVKPSGVSADDSADALTRELSTRIGSFSKRREIHDLLSEKPRPAAPSILTTTPSVNRARRPNAIAISVVAIGVSTGGPQALTRVLPALPANFPTPILVVQHMPPMFTESLARDLNGRCKIAVSEGKEGQTIEAGQVIIAPGGRQMGINRSFGKPAIHLTDDPPMNNCRPAVDYLFRAVAKVFGPRALGVIMTGMGNDGTMGCRLFKKNGAHVIVQDEQSCVVYGMPRAPAEEGLADAIVSLDRMADEIVKVVSRETIACK